jgi:hypothetical protein
MPTVEIYYTYRFTSKDEKVHVKIIPISEEKELLESVLEASKGNLKRNLSIAKDTSQPKGVQVCISRKEIVLKTSYLQFCLVKIL